MAKANEVYGGGDFLKAVDLQGKRRAVVIESCEVQTGNFGSQLVLSFVGKDKKFSLNKTNARMITSLLGTDDTDEWIGRAISLRPDKTQNPEGAMVDCIRVDFELPEMPAKTPQVAQAAASADWSGSVGNNDYKTAEDDDIPF